MTKDIMVESRVFILYNLDIICPKFESCNLVDWQLSYDPLIILYSNKDIQDSLNLLVEVSSNCKFNGSFEFKEEIDENVKIFVIKN